MGRKDIATTDQSLLRTERIVNDTIAIGAQTAETLQQQGKQLEKVRGGQGRPQRRATSPPGATHSSAREAALLPIYLSIRDALNPPALPCRCWTTWTRSTSR